MSTQTDQSAGKGDKSSRVEEIALSIYSQNAFSRPGISQERLAVESLRAAAAFDKVAGELRRGKLKLDEKPADSVLSDASAPNLPKTHPINMVSKRFGSVETRNELIERLRSPHKHDVTADSDDPGRNKPYLESLLGVKSEALRETVGAN